MHTTCRSSIGCSSEASGSRAPTGTYGIVNPATEEVVGEAPEASVDQALAAARAAQAAFPGVVAHARNRAGPSARTPSPTKLRERSADLVPLIISETGATAMVGSRMQVPGRDRTVRAVRPWRDRRTSTRRSRRRRPAPLPSPPGGLIGAVVNRQPVGAVACISPYNFPLVNMAGKIAPALAVGCTVVMKPAPQDPLAILELAEIMHEVGFPPGVVNVVTSSRPEPSVALTETKDIDMVSFTGSTAVGRARSSKPAGQTMKRLLLELGGKGAGLVLDDANIDVAVGAIASVWAFHTGQICTAPTRAVVHRSRYDELVVAAQLRTRRTSRSATRRRWTPSSVRSSRPRSATASSSYIAIGVDEGAELVVDGRRPAPHGHAASTSARRCSPAAKQGMTPVQEEIFGPVVVVVPFDDDDEGIAIANSTDFGLYDYVFSTDSDRAYRTAKQLRSGNVGINTAQRNHDAPFGGFKLSGVGRDGGDYGMLAYTEMQTIVWPG